MEEWLRFTKELFISGGENFKISPFRKVKEKLFVLRQKYKDEKNDLMQGLVK